MRRYIACCLLILGLQTVPTLNLEHTFSLTLLMGFFQAAGTTRQRLQRPLSSLVVQRARSTYRDSKPISDRAGPTRLHFKCLKTAIGSNRPMVDSL